MALLPLPLAVVAWILTKVTRNGRKPKLMEVLFRDLYEERTSEKIKVSDATSIEFRDHFLRMVGQALTDANETENAGELIELGLERRLSKVRKLVLVIDNLDRLDPADAIGLWSTMRVFLEPDGKTEASLLNKLWLIVPFDYSALEKLWQDKGPHAVSSFFDKTFQISTFSVLSSSISWATASVGGYRSMPPTVCYDGYQTSSNLI